MRKFIAILILLIVLPLYVGAEENFTIGKKDLNGTFGENGRSTRQAWINTIIGEGPTSDDFETYLYFADPTAVRSQTFQDASGTIALTESIGSTISLADTKVIVGQSSGLGASKSLTFTGDLSGTLPNTGIWNAQIVANAVTNTELDNTDDYTVHDLTVTGDLFIQGSSGPYGEFYGEDLAELTLDAGVWANIPGVMNGVFTTGMALNNATGCQTVTYAGVYEAIGSVSYEDPDGNNESYHFSYTVDGAVQDKCQEHTDIRVQSVHEAVPITCLLPLSGGEEVCAAVVSVGGDDVHIEHMNWYLKR